MNKKYLTPEAKMFEEIRSLLNLTIEEFVYQMNWSNIKYYNYIKNGRRRPGELKKKPTHPSVDKVFTGLNHALKNHSNWKEKSAAIKKIIEKNLMTSF